MGRHEWRSNPIQQAPPSSATGTVPRPCGRVRSKRTTCAWIVRARQFTAQGRTKRRASPVPFTHAPNNDRQPFMPKAAPREKTRRAKLLHSTVQPGPARWSRRVAGDSSAPGGLPGNHLGHRTRKEGRLREAALSWAGLLRYGPVIAVLPIGAAPIAVPFPRRAAFVSGVGGLRGKRPAPRVKLTLLRLTPCPSWHFRPSRRAAGG